MQVFMNVRRLVVVGFVVAIVCCGMTISSVQAGTISVSFQGGAGANGLVGANSAGVVPALGWNDLTGSSQTNFNLLDESGASSGATLTYSGLNGFTNAINLSNLGDTRMMAGNLYAQTFNPLSLSIGGTIPYANYDLYVYYSGNVTASQTMDVSIVEAVQTLLANDGGLANETSFIESISGSQGNYVRFTNITESNFTLTLQGVGAQYAYLNGFQLVEVVLPTPPVPEPATVSLLGLGSLLMIKRIRRRNRGE